MKVWSHSVYSSPMINEETLELDNRVVFKLGDQVIAVLLIDSLPAFFENRNYGSGVKEVYYHELCLIPEHKDPIDAYFTYHKRKKLIPCIVDLDYDLVLTMEVMELRRYVAEMYLKRTEDFFKMEIKDFDCEAYLKDLKTFFLPLLG